MSETTVDFSRKWYVMSAVAMSIFLATVDGSIVNVALPTMVEALDTDFPTVQWVALAYLLTQATLLVSVGRLGDMLGKKRIYNAGFIVFTLGSVLCGLSPNVYTLIGFRILQAIGASMMFALGAAIVTEAFPPEERGKALGINGMVVSIGIIAGPTLGGILIDALSWHWIFFVNLPVGITGAYLAWRFVPDLRPSRRQKFDLPGALLMFAGLLSLLLALTAGQRLGFAAPPILALFATSALCLALFLRLETRAAQPMIDLTIFRNRLFAVNLLNGLLGFLCVSGMTLLLPFYLDLVLGYDTRQVGLLLAVIPIFLGVFAPLSGALSDRLGSRPITIAGLGIILLGYLWLTTLDQNTTTWGFVLRMLPIGIGYGIFQSPNNSAVMGSVSRQRLGVASGLLSISRAVGQTTGIALLGAFWAARVAAYYGAPLPGGATSGPPPALVSGLQESYLAAAILIGIALALSLWTLLGKRSPAPSTAPSP